MGVFPGTDSANSGNALVQARMSRAKGISGVELPTLKEVGMETALEQGKEAWKKSMESMESMEGRKRSMVPRIPKYFFKNSEGSKNNNNLTESSIINIYEHLYTITVASRYKLV